MFECDICGETDCECVESISDEKSMNCPECNEDIDLELNTIQYYPERLFECHCGTVFNEKREDVTDDYYNI